MGQRRGNGAVSIGLSALLFLMMGCVIAVGSMLAGFEASDVKGALAFYALMAVPLFLASMPSSLESSDHRSFRDTHSHMQGKRVKPRLQLIRGVTTLLALSAGLGTFFGTVALGCSERVPGGLLTVLLFGVPTAAYFLTRAVLKWFFVWRGWMTTEEARDLTTRSDRLPDSCLEPVDDGKPASRDLIVRRIYLAALAAMFVAAAAVLIVSRHGLVPGGAIVKWILVFGTAASAYFVVVSALKQFYIWRGLVSREEAASFPSWSHQRPEFPLDSTDTNDVAKASDQTPGK